jgi:prepilin-type N-terminal cleavage/methylation domain-containing protein
MSAMHLNNRRGFSLVEMAVVVTVMGLVLAITAPGLIRQLNSQRVRDAAGILRDEMRLARQKAITNGTRNYVYVQWGPDAAQYWTGIRTFNDANKTWNGFTWRGPIDLPTKTMQIGANFSGSYTWFYYDPTGKPHQPFDTGLPWPSQSPIASGSVKLISTVPSIVDTVAVNLDLSGSVW